MGEQAIDFSKAPVLKVLAALGSDPKQGLVEPEAASRLAKFGPNALEEKKTNEWAWGCSASSGGRSPAMIEAAALMAAIVKDWGDFSIILALLAFNASLGFFEEHQASNALAALKNALALKAKVLRGGAWSEVAAQNIVPGDIVKIRLGDIVPADALLISGAFLSVDQAALTGESPPVSKKEGDRSFRFDRQAGRNGSGGHRHRRRHFLWPHRQIGAESRCRHPISKLPSCASAIF